MTNQGLLALRLRQILERDIVREIDCWPAVRERVAGQRSRAQLRAWRWALACMALLVAALLLPFFTSLMRPANVSAADVLDRAASANAVAPGNQSLSYHLVATRTDISPSGQTGTTGVEVWFGGGGRYREDTRWPDQTTVVGTDGSDTWMYLTTQGRTYAARGINLRTQKDLVPSGQGDVAQLLAALSKRACGPANLTGEATVARRTAYLVHVSGQATPASCEDRSKLATASTSSAQPVPVDMTLAIDKQTFVLLRSETSGPKGTQRYEVSRIEYDPQFATTLFTFAPPAGAVVVDSPAALKQQLAPPGTPKAEKAP